MSTIHSTVLCSAFLYHSVGAERFELSSLAAYGPEPYAYTNSATRPFHCAKNIWRNIFLYITLNHETPFSVHLLQNTDIRRLADSSARAATLRKVL